MGAASGAQAWRLALRGSGPLDGSTDKALGKEGAQAAGSNEYC